MMMVVLHFQTKTLRRGLVFFFGGIFGKTQILAY